MTEMEEDDFIDPDLKKTHSFFRKKSEISKLQDIAKKILESLDSDQENTRVGECIKQERKRLKQRYPTWSERMINKRAQTQCGQKASVLINDESIEECVQRKIPIIKNENPEWEQEQVVAVAYSWCREHQSKDQTEEYYKCIAKRLDQIKEESPQWKHERQLAVAINWCKDLKMEDKEYSEEYYKCIAKRLDGLKQTNPHMDQDKMLAMAINSCKEIHMEDHLPKTDPLLTSFQFIRKTDDSASFLDYTKMMGYHVSLEDKAICYKMENIEETEDEYIVPVILAKAMVQPYPKKDLIMAKRPEDLSKAVAVDYETGQMVDKLPTFEFHPPREERENENGYVTDIRWQPKKERLVGILHVNKKKLSDNLTGYFKRRESIHVSIGFMYVQGPGGVFKANNDNQWNGVKYDAAQQHILLTHLALLPPNAARGRCPLPYCGVGININDSISLAQEIDAQNYQITDRDGVIEVIDNLYVKTEQETFNLTDALRNQSQEISQLKTTLRNYFIRLGQALNR